MYKAIKDNKIIAINEENKFPCLIYDNIVEDTEHTVDDYEQHNGEFILKSQVPAPTKDDIKQMRIDYRHTHIDDQTLERNRKMANGTWTQEDEAEYLALDAEVTAYIEQNLPYPTDPITEGEENADTQD